MPDTPPVGRSTLEDHPSSVTLATEMADDAYIHERGNADEDLINVSSAGILSEASANADDTELASHLGMDERKHKNEVENQARDDPKSDDESEEIDLTPLEYSRINGLARDHLAEKYAEVEAIQQDVVLDLLPDSHLPQFKLGEEIKVEERMSMSKDGASLLASVARVEAVEAIHSLIVPMLELKKRAATSKLELPLLRTHHKTDCKNFGKREGFEIKLRDVKLPLEVVNEDTGQGLAWPARFWDIGPQILEQLRAEKISVSKDGMSCLQESLNVVWTGKDNQNLWNKVEYKRNIALDPVTPPLSPIHVKSDPFEPSSTDSAFDVPILSDPVDPTMRELEEIEKKLFEQDFPTPLRRHGATESPANASPNAHTRDELMKLGDIYSPLASLDSSSSSTTFKSDRARRQDLKVEEPMTPNGPSISPPKAVHFSEVIEELTLHAPQSRLNSPEFENKFFEEAFGPAAEMVNQKLEQEKLIEADAIARVDVPLMDFSKPDPPWRQFEIQNDLASTLLMQKLFIRDVVGQDAVKWAGKNKANMRLRWLPFDKKVVKAATEEKIEMEEGALEAFSGNVSCQDVVDSSSLTWKPSGLMVLRQNDEDDDEIEPCQFRTPNPLDLASLVKKRKQEMALDLTSLVKKRKQELQERSASTNCASELPVVEPSEIFQAIGLTTSTTGVNAPGNQVSGGQPSKPNGFISAPERIDIDPTQQNFGDLLGGTFSAENSLDNYLELRGTKKPKLTDSSYFGAKVTKPVQPSKEPEQVRHLPIRISPVARADPLPVPPINTPKTRLSVIVASTLLKHRNLIKHIMKLLPSLELVERDFEAHNTTIWMPGSVTRSPIVSPLAAEADLLISGSTGVLITTIQKIKQKLLPGQKGKTALRERVEKVSLRYERLVVLVSEGRADESTDGIDESDSLAFCEFVGFTLGLENSINVQFVAGGEETMGKWIANTIVQNQVAETSELLLDETHWESFLRRAGMNAFAAQIIICQLKAPDGVDSTSPTKAGHFGLTAFVEMDPMERVARFSRFCGRKLLERVSVVIDRDWKM